jgi:hypothetical protein
MIVNVGTAAVIFAILKRYSETLSPNYVSSRTIEATIIGVGAISLSPSSPCATTWPHLSARTEQGLPSDVERGSGRDSASVSTASCSAG